MWSGKPLADFAVGAAAAPAKTVLLKTDTEGRVAFRLDRPGLLRAPLIRPVAAQPGTWESTFTTLTLEVKPK